MKLAGWLKTHPFVNEARSMMILASQGAHRFDTSGWRGWQPPTRLVAVHPLQPRHPGSGTQFSTLEELL